MAKIRKIKCPHCGHAVSIAEPYRQICFTVCMGCTGVLRLTPEMSLREATLHEALAISPILLEKLQTLRHAIQVLKEQGELP